VSNTEDVIRIIQGIQKEKGGRVHMIGIGSGVSVDMIKRGAEYGGGLCIFIRSEITMKKQIISLLGQIIMPKLSKV
jgi:hypothetical protein